MRRWIDVAVLTKTKNLDGSFVAYSAAGLPFLLVEGMEVAFVPPQTDLPRTSIVKTIASKDDTAAIVAFDGINDLATAKRLVGCHCLIERALIDPAIFMEEPRMWAGWSVVDEQWGCLGEVANVVENPGQALIQVKREGESETDSAELLIPFVDEIVVYIDVDSSTINVHVPKGLLDL